MFGNLFSSAQRFIEEQKKRVQPVVSRIQQAVQPAITNISRAISSSIPRAPMPAPARPIAIPSFQPITQAVSGLAGAAQRFIQPAFEAARKVVTPAYPFGLNAPPFIAESVGKTLQKFPETTIKVTPKKTGEQYPTIFGGKVPVTEMAEKVIPAVSNMPGAIIRSTGQTFERLATPKGREVVAKGAKEILPQIAKGDVSALLENPAVQAGLDISNFIPGIGFVGGGIRTTAAKQALKTVGKKATKEAVETMAQKGATLFGKELQPLAQEARKYKSAEEFASRTAFGQPAYIMTAQSSLFNKITSKYKGIMESLAKEGKLTPEKTVELGKQMDIEKKKVLTDFYTQATGGVKPTLFGKAPKAVEVKPVVKSTLQPTQAAKVPEKLALTEKISPMAPPPSIIKEEFAGNIRLAKIDAPDEVKDLLVRIANENADLIEQQRRGVVHTKEIVAEDIARKTGMTAEKFMQTKAGKAMNAEELATLDAFMVRKMTNVQELAGKIQSGDLTAVTQAQFYKELNEAIQLEAVAAGGRAEAGRSLESLKHLRDALQNPEQLRMEQVLKALGGRDVTEELATKIAKLDFNNPAEVFSFLRNIYKPNLRQYIGSLFFNSILSGPSTHLINSISNTLFAAVNNILVRPVRAGVEIPIAALQGRQREYYFREVIPAITGMVEGSQQGLRRAIEFMLRGYDATDIAGASKVERLFRVEPFRGKTSFINLPSRALRAADLFFKSINFNAELSAGAARQTAKEGLEGAKFAERMTELLKNPSLKMLDDAGDFADYVTFTSKPDKITSTIIGLRDKVVGSEFVIPFISTPSNLVKRGFEFSPVRFGLAAGKGGAQVSDQLAKAIVGSTIASTLAMMFWSGGITAGVPKTPAARDEFYRQGKQPYSIKIGDTWMQFQRLEPLNTALSQIAAFYDAFVNNAEMPTWDKILSIAETLGENVVSQTWLRGVADAIDAIREPQRKLAYFAESKVAGFIPTFSAQVARATDEYVRQPRGLGERLAERIPGLRETIQPKLNVMGQPIETRGIAGELFPIKFSPETTDPVERELGRLDVNIDFPTNTVTTKKKNKIELTREGQYIYTQLAGQAIKQRLDRALQSPQWQEATDKEKNAFIRRVANEERENVRAGMIRLANYEYEGRPMGVEELNNRLTEIGSSLKITELPTQGPLNIIQSINEEEFKPGAIP